MINNDKKPWEVFEEEILPRLTPYALFGDLKNLRQPTNQWTASCPFHDDHNPSFSVNPKSLTWFCHAGCGGGGPIQYIIQRHNCSWMEAARLLAELAGVDPTTLETWRDRWTDADFRKHSKLERRSALFEAFHIYSKEILKDILGKPARDFLHNRGFQEADLPSLSFGYYPESKDVRQHLLDLKFTEEEIGNSKILFDTRWKGRLVIPWKDIRGRITTFVARDISGSSEDAEKYLYLKDGTKSGLFGLNEALKSSKTRTDLILVEGILDVALFQSMDFINVAAIGGSGNLLNPERLNFLVEKKIRSITLALDNDSSGEKGIIKAIDNVHKVKNPPQLWVLPPVKLGDSKDPDEYVRKHGIDDFRELLKSRVSGYVYRGLNVLRDVTPSSPEKERIEAIECLFEYMINLGSGSELNQEELLRITAERTGISRETLKNELKKSKEKRDEQNRSEALKNNLSKAQRDIEHGKRSSEVIQALESQTSLLRVSRIDIPPRFSVDRLLQESRTLPEGLSSGWPAVDDMDVRFQAKELTVVGARTGHGKTSLLINLLYNWAKNESYKGDKVFVLYSAEEPEVRVFHRLLSLLTAVISNDDTKRWTVNDVRKYLRDSKPDWPELSLDVFQKAQEQLRGLENHIQLVERSHWTSEEIVADVHRLSKEREVGGVLIDYLQRIPAPPGSYDRRDVAVSTVARQFKSLAVDLRIPVVVGAQINRQAVSEAPRIPTGKDYNYKHTDVQKALRARRPQLHQLREGGSEQEADLVLGLLNYAADYADEQAEEDSSHGGKHTGPTKLEVGTLKNRYGPANRWATLAFDGRYSLIRSVESEDNVE